MKKKLYIVFLLVGMQLCLFESYAGEPIKNNVFPTNSTQEEDYNLKTGKGFLLEKLDKELSDSLTVVEFNFGIIPQHGLYAIYGNKLIGMDAARNHEIDELCLPDTIKIEEFVALNDLIVLKSGYAIITLDSICEFDGWLMDTRDFHLDLCTDSTIAIYYEGSVFDCNPETRTMKPLFSVGEYRVLSYIPTGDDESLIITNTYVLQKKQKEVIPLFRFQDNANAVVFSSIGIFYGTDTGLYEINEDGDVLQIFEFPVYTILDDGKVVYIVTKEGIIYKIYDST